VCLCHPARASRENEGLGSCGLRSHETAYRYEHGDHVSYHVKSLTRASLVTNRTVFEASHTEQADWTFAAYGTMIANVSASASASAHDRTIRWS
jgi:hypothetical protein